MLPGRQYTPEDLVRIVLFRKWIILACMVVFTTAALMFGLRLPDSYKSETLILVIPQRIPESYVRSTITMRIEDRLRSITQEILSRSRLEKVITEFNLYPDERKAHPMEQVVETMRDDINIETVKDDSFKVTYVSNAARTAMIVTDRLASMFIDENTRDRDAMAQGTNEFLESQLEDARHRLITHEKKLEDFRRRYSGELPSQLQTNLQVIQGAQNQIQNLTESINRDRDRMLLLEKGRNDALQSDGSVSSPSIDSNGSADPSSLTALDQLERARTELRSLELRFRPEHPDVVAKKRVVAELERKVQQESPATSAPTVPERPVNSAELIRRARAREYQAEMDKLGRQIAAKEADADRLRRQVSDYQKRVDAVPGHESEQTELMRDYDTLQKIYSGLLAKKEDSKISANLERQQVGEQFRILDPARLPEKPFSPNRLRIDMIGFAFGLVAGLAFAAFFEYRDTSLHSEDEIVRTLVLPVLAAIPIMSAVADQRRRRRFMIATVTMAALSVAGMTAAALWRLGLLKGLL